MQETNSNNSFTWNDLLWDCIAHWKWFVFSIVVCLSAAIYKIASSNDIFEAKASVLIKTEDRGAAMSRARDAFNMMGFGSLGSNVHNEMLTMKSPTLLAEVIEKLRLNETFTMQKGLRQVDLYKQEPVIVMFENADALNKIVRMDIRIVSHTEFELDNVQVGLDELDGKIKAAAGTYVNILSCRALISPSTNFTDDLVGHTINYMHAPSLAIAEIYAQSLMIEMPDREASVIDLSVRDASPVKAIDLLRTLIEVYNDNWVFNENAKIRSISEMVNDRIDMTLKELNEAEGNISSYMSNNLVSDFQQASSAYFSQNLELTRQILDYRTQVNIAKSMLSSLSDSEYLTLPSNSGLTDGAIVSQIHEYNQLILERNKLMENTSESNQVVVNLTKSLQLIRSGVEKSLNGMIENTNMVIESLEKQQKSSQHHLSNTPKEARHLANIQREQKIKEELYLFLLEKKEENDMSLTFASDNSRVIVAPYSTLIPVAPNKRLIILAALILAFMLPIAILLLLVLFDTTVHTKKDLESLKTAYLGEVPLFEDKNQKKYLPRWLREKFGKKRVANYEVLVQKNSRNSINESIRLLRSKLDFMNKAGNNKVIMVSSIQPASGKSFISMNLATSYVLKECKVLVIDMDLRKATASKYVKEAKLAKGLADYLSEPGDDYSEIIIKNAIIEGFDLIPVGTMPPNPAELILSDKLSPMIEKLRQEYDYIFIDCPPIDIVAESGEIARYADIALFVVRAGIFEKALLPEIDELYNKKLFKNMVVVLNGVTASGHYGYGKYGYGRYGYGRYGSNHYGYYESEKD